MPKVAHSICHQALRTSTKVGLTTSFSDTLYSAAVIHNGHTVGGYGPGAVNLIANTLLTNQELRDQIFESILSKKLEELTLF